KVSGSGIEFDKEKIEAMSKLPYPTNVKAIQSFSRHVGFCRRFIKDFSQVARPMTQLLEKDTLFNFFEECIQAFDKLKHKLTQAPIMIKPDWSLAFEVMCNASDYAVRAVLWQRIEKHFKPTHYASKMMNEAQENYTMTEKELLAVIESYEGVSHEMRWHKSFDSVTAAHQEIIMVLPQPQEKSSKPTFTSQVSSMMHIDWSEVTMLVNELATSPIGMKYLKKAQAFPASDARNVVNFLKRLFTRFRIPKAFISDRGTHLCNNQMEKVMKRHRVVPDSPLHITPRQTGRWYGPFSVSKDMKNGAIELYNKDGNEFIVNKQRAKPYQKDVLDTNKDGDITLDDEGEVT
ncbi:reverse transcriptase domain-containing protein, partial [Tanacetum coccineum]